MLREFTRSTTGGDGPRQLCCALSIRLLRVITHSPGRCWLLANEMIPSSPLDFSAVSSVSGKYFTTPAERDSPTDCPRVMNELSRGVKFSLAFRSNLSKRKAHTVALVRRHDITHAERIAVFFGLKRNSLTRPQKGLFPRGERKNAREEL